MPRSPSPPLADTAPRLRRAYFECRFGQLHVHNAIPPGGGFDEGIALICLHDDGASGREFRELLPLLGRDRSVYAPDLPGSGESDPPAGPVSAAEIAGAVADFITEMRLRQCDLLASRRGLLVAIELALHRPQQVRRIATVSAPLAPERHVRERIRQVTQPVLVLRPRGDLWDVTGQVREALPKAQIVDLPDCEADVLRAAPAVVTRSIGPFLRR